MDQRAAPSRGRRAGHRHAGTQLLAVLALVAVLGSGCAGTAVVEEGSSSPTPAAPTPAGAAAFDLGGVLLASGSTDPEVAAGVPPVALDAAAQQTLADLIAAEGGDGEAVAAADPETHLLAAFDLGECTVGEARLVLDDGALRVEGRESDGVCEAIDHEVQVWGVPWGSVPDGTTVGGTAVSAP